MLCSHSLTYQSCWNNSHFQNKQYSRLDYIQIQHFKKSTVVLQFKKQSTPVCQALWYRFATLWALSQVGKAFMRLYGNEEYTKLLGMLRKEQLTSASSLYPERGLLMIL